MGRPMPQKFGSTDNHTEPHRKRKNASSELLHHRNAPSPGRDLASNSIKGIKLAMVCIPLQLIVGLDTRIPLLSAPEVAANVPGLALEAVVTFLTAAEHTALLLELRHGDRREFRRSVHLG